MIRTGSILCLSLVALSAGALFNVSYQVEDLLRQKSRLTRAIASEHESIRVLQAEWAFLNRPERIEALARKHLAMQPALAEQTLSDSQLAARLAALPAPVPPAPASAPELNAPATQSPTLARAVTRPVMPITYASLGDAAPRDRVLPPPLPARPVPAASGTIQTGDSSFHTQLDAAQEATDGQ